MNDTVGKFCDSVHERLETLQGRLESLKLNIGTTCHLLQEKLVEVRKNNEDRKQAVAETRIKLELWIRESRFEAKHSDDRENTNREIPNLSERARTAEDCVAAAIMLAEASIDAAELMILEAIAAGRDAEAVASD